MSIAAYWAELETDPEIDGHLALVQFRRLDAIRYRLIQGTAAAIGTATLPTVSDYGVLLADVRLYNGQTTIVDADIHFGRVKYLKRLMSQWDINDSPDFKVLQDDPLDLSVTANPGVGNIGGTIISYAGGTPGFFSLPAPGDSRYDVVYVDFAGNTLIQEGVEVIDPAVPSIPTDTPGLVLAAVLLHGSTTVITQEAITDLRGFLSTVGGISFPVISGQISAYQHGNLGGGSLHAVATESVPGFMSAADKTKLDGITPGGGTTAGYHLPFTTVNGSPNVPAIPTQQPQAESVTFLSQVFTVGGNAQVLVSVSGSYASFNTPILSG